MKIIVDATTTEIANLVSQPQDRQGVILNVSAGTEATEPTDVNSALENASLDALIDELARRQGVEKVSLEERSGLYAMHTKFERCGRRYITCPTVLLVNPTYLPPRR